MRYSLSSAQRRKLASEGISLARVKEIDTEAPKLPIKSASTGWDRKLSKALEDPGLPAHEPMGERSNIAGEPPLDKLSRPHQAKQSGVKSPPPNISPRM